MFGRVGIGALTELFSWQTAIAVLGVVDLAAAFGFLLLPASRNFTRVRRFEPRLHLSAWARHLTRPGLPPLFSVGFLAMGPSSLSITTQASGCRCRPMASAPLRSA